MLCWVNGSSKMNILLNLDSLLWLSISVLIGSITYYSLKWMRIFRYWKSRNIATPLPVPLLGNSFKQFFGARPEVDLEWQKSLGKIYGYYLFEKPTLTVAEPEVLKQILVKDFYLFRNRENSGSRHKIFSKILLFARNEDWKRIRAIASPTFTSGKLRKMYPIINKCCTDFMENLEQKVGNTTQINLKQWTRTYTLDVIARCAFASNVNTYDNPNNEFLSRGKRVFNIPGSRQVILFTLPKFLFRIQALRRLILGATDNNMFFVNFAAQVMKHRRDNNEKHNDFLQLLMDVEKSDGQTDGEGSDDKEAHHLNEGVDELKADKEALSDVIEKKLTEDEILAQSFLFLVAGFETTASTLAFCIYELAVHPELQQRLFDEIQTAIDENGEIKYEVITRLPFLDALLSETLRSYPPIPRLQRQAMEDVLLVEPGIKIEKGILVEVPVYAIHHDPENHPDPFNFNPDRFMPENRHLIKPYTYIPFGGGPRNCIGMRFALLEAKVAVALISQKFKLSRVAATDVPVVFSKGKGLMQAKRLVIGIEKR